MIARIAAVAAACVVVAALPAGAQAAEFCGSVENPYPNTRYEGEDLKRVLASGVSCTTARRVAKRAHREALGRTPSLSGILRFRWGDWRVRGDLRPASDRYLAVRGEDRVRWQF